MRTQTHIVDSRAVKAVMAHLPDHWVVRELTERDYGIDLMVEIFTPGLKDAKGKDAFTATGSVFHIQIKGTEEVLKPVQAGTINYCIDKNSLSYVEKFSIPFFLFRVSVEDPQEIYFGAPEKEMASRLGWRQRGRGRQHGNSPKSLRKNGLRSRVFPS